MALWRSIPDADIDAYSPVTARLFRRLRYQQYGCRSVVMQGMARESASSGQLSTSMTTWTVAGQIRIWVPPWCVGDNGTRMIMRARVQAVRIGTGTAQGHYRLKHGTDYSNEESSSSSSGEWKTFTLDTSGFSAGAVNAIDVEMYISGTATDKTAYFTWLDERAASLLEAR